LHLFLLHSQRSTTLFPYTTLFRSGLHGVLDKCAGELSHGQKQWLEIAIVVLQDPKLMLIDEPAAGMSDRETEKTGELLLELSTRSEEHTSELQSRENLVCRLLLEK